MEERNKLQSDLDRLECWAENNRMKFNRDKCQVLHLGKRNQMHSYKTGDNWVSNITDEKDLGIVVDRKLNMSQQCDVAVKKANAIWGCINRSIASKSHEILVALLRTPSSLSALLLKCGAQNWAQYSR